MSGKKLSDLLRRELAEDPRVTGVTADSRKVKRGYLFAALPGAKVDGRDFVPAAVRAGASAVIAEAMLNASVPVIKVADARRAYALAAAAFWGAQPKTCVAVTGTNGKTSVATFCRQIFERLGHASPSVPMLADLRPSRWKIWRQKAAIEVLPLVPVTATQVFGWRP